MKNKSKKRQKFEDELRDFIENDPLMQEILIRKMDSPEGKNLYEKTGIIDLTEKELEEYKRRKMH